MGFYIYTAHALIKKKIVCVQELEAFFSLRLKE